MFASFLLLLSLINVREPQGVAAEHCAAGKVTINSRVLQGQIILHDKRKPRPAVDSVVEFFVLRDGGWKPYSSIKAVNLQATFVLLEVDPGTYMLNAKLEGYGVTTTYVEIKKGEAKREVVIQLDNGRCSTARLRKTN